MHVTKIDKHRNPSGQVVSIEASCACGWSSIAIVRSNGAQDDATGELVVERRMTGLAMSHRIQRELP